MDKIIKLAYICHFSNKHISNKLPLRLSWKDKLILSIKRQPLSTSVDDFAIWNTNAIAEMKKHIKEVEMHVIAPYSYLATPFFEFKEDGIWYHFFRSENNLNAFMQRNVLPFLKLNYRQERKCIASLIHNINPDIVHIVGAENPYYSLSALDVPQKIPLIVQLQTLVNEPEFQKNYNRGSLHYKYRKDTELMVLKRADYIATPVTYFHKLIRKIIKKNKFLLMVLPLAEPIDISIGEKKFDFVYYAANINKAADYAIEAFILASKRHPGITLDIVGGYQNDYRRMLEQRLIQAGLIDMVTFEGRLPSHEDVIQQVRLSRHAILPLKIDQISGTIRESMANGLPVVTTITPATPNLNKQRPTVLLSDKGDFQSMADNMCKLLSDPELADTLRKNGEIYMNERSSNASIVNTWMECYKAILNFKESGIPIPEQLVSN